MSIDNGAAAAPASAYRMRDAVVEERQLRIRTAGAGPHRQHRRQVVRQRSGRRAVDRAGASHQQIALQHVGGDAHPLTKIGRFGLRPRDPLAIVDYPQQHDEGRGEDRRCDEHFDQREAALGPASSHAPRHHRGQQHVVSVPLAAVLTWSGHERRGHGGDQHFERDHAGRIGWQPMDAPAPDVDRVRRRRRPVPHPAPAAIEVIDVRRRIALERARPATPRARGHRRPSAPRWRWSRDPCAATGRPEASSSKRHSRLRSCSILPAASTTAIVRSAATRPASMATLNSETTPSEITTRSARATMTSIRVKPAAETSHGEAAMPSGVQRSRPYATRPNSGVIRCAVFQERGGDVRSGCGGERGQA